MEAIIESMGSRVIKTPKDYCYIVSSSMDHMGIREAVKRFDNVKVVV